jgi:pyrimidine operon attenuation protein/uracil phosphoribosyltransferase
MEPTQDDRQEIPREERKMMSKNVLTKDQLVRIEDVLSCARVADAMLEQLIDTTPVEMWVRVFHDKMHRALEAVDAHRNL